MSKTSVADMDIVVANNTDVNAVGISGSSSISSGDDALRSYAALLARFYDSLGATATIGGTASAITATITEDWTAYATGMVLAIKAASATTGATTLNVTPAVQAALGIKKIRRQGDSALQANDMLANGVYLLRYDAAYDSAAGAWVLMNPGVSGFLSASATSLITVGYTVTPNNLGTVSSGTVTLDGTLGQTQYLTNGGAFTLAAPAADTEIDLLVTNNASAGSITFSGFTVGTNTGSALTTTNTNKFLVSVRRINAVSTYSIYALQ